MQFPIDLDPALLDARPPVAALRARPMSVAEIDAHPDAARIWATIAALRQERHAAVEESQMDVDADEIRSDALSEAEKALERLLEDNPSATAKDALAALEDL